LKLSEKSSDESVSSAVYARVAGGSLSVHGASLANPASAQASGSGIFGKAPSDCFKALATLAQEIL
jgi:hypothetical protein